jgi:hypothetical protein
MINFKMKFKTYEDLVERQVRNKATRALFRTAAYVRTVAKRSLRSSSGNRTSPVGAGAPFSHTRRLKNAIGFGKLSPTRFIIGPGFTVGGNNTKDPILAIGARRPTIPSIIEFGGIERDRLTGKTHKYVPRPYMRNALAKTINGGILANNLSRRGV